MNVEEAGFQLCLQLEVCDGVQEGSCRRGLRWLGRAPALVETSWVLKLRGVLSTVA